MVTEEESVSLHTLANGGAVESFNVELQKVLNDIMDPNTKPDAKRSIVLKVTVKPTLDRELGDVEVTCDAKLASSKPIITRLFMGLKGDKAVAVEHDPNQASLFKEEEKPNNLHSISGGKE